MVKETANLIDMHNRISAGQLEKVLRMQLKTLEEHPELAHVLPPLMVWGAPGLGKSSIIKGIADEMGISFIDVRLAQREPVDVRGLPVPSPFAPRKNHGFPSSESTIRRVASHTAESYDSLSQRYGMERSDGAFAPSMKRRPP